ncbi:MAG: DUF2199 domain-containing protein [Hymenobacteraceae bacterium]|nr:DUF2199 domain-containing protein [Hymenobacteraceae bacterium]
MTYQCSHCGQTHDDLPDLVFDLPEPIRELTSEERLNRAWISADRCVLDDEHFFIRGVIKIPIQDQEGYFGFGVWVSQSEVHFMHYQDHPDEDDYGPFFGWLANDIAYFEEETLLLKTQAHFRTGGLRPYIELEQTDHPLAVMQREGIVLEKAWEIVHQALDK